MSQYLAMITLVVNDYDEAIDYYTNKLQFELIEDSLVNENKRWVVISPTGDNSGTNILLAKASTENQSNSVGNQTGGRVFLFLHTDDFWRDYEQMKDREIEFIEEPRKEPFGTVVVFKDLYGNKWDFIEWGL